MYDRYSQIVLDAQIAAAVLGDPITREFVLIDPSGPIPQSLHNRGLVFIGVTGIVNGLPRTAFALELDASALDAVAHAWVRYLAARIMPYLQHPTDDTVQFLERLYALEDTRCK
jgi:hypothetical protein